MSAGVGVLLFAGVTHHHVRWCLRPSVPSSAGHNACPEGRRGRQGRGGWGRLPLSAAMICRGPGLVRLPRPFQLEERCPVRRPPALFLPFFHRAQCLPRRATWPAGPGGSRLGTVVRGSARHWSRLVGLPLPFQLSDLCALARASALVGRVRRNYRHPCTTGGPWWVYRLASGGLRRWLNAGSG